MLEEIEARKRKLRDDYENMDMLSTGTLICDNYSFLFRMILI